jgi:hypothetical protein
MRTAQARNRGFNLILTAFALLTGLAFVSVEFGENNLITRLDDLGLLALGAILMVWYLIRDNRFHRSLVPVIIILLTVPLQTWGLLNEVSTSGGMGNDIVGMYIYPPVAFFAVYLYFRWSRVPVTRPPA